MTIVPMLICSLLPYASFWPGRLRQGAGTGSLVRAELGIVPIGGQSFPSTRGGCDGEKPGVP